MPKPNTKTKKNTPSLAYRNRSSKLRDAIKTYLKDSVPGCVFYVTKNGLPYADGSFGKASFNPAPNGLNMTKDTIVHTGSVEKVFCIVAILRLIDEWNHIFNSSEQTKIDIKEQYFYNTVRGFGKGISINSEIYPFLTDTFLRQDLIQKYRDDGFIFPSSHLRSITFRHLLNHTSGIQESLFDRDRWEVADYGVASWVEVSNEPGDYKLTTENWQALITGCLKNNLKQSLLPTSTLYSNSGYAILGALIQTITGRQYYDWVTSRLFRNIKDYSQMKRSIVDLAKTATYYKKNGSQWLGNLHPDYTNFNASGGWYMTAVSFCNWFDKIMQEDSLTNNSYIFGGFGPFNKFPFTSNYAGPIIRNPNQFIVNPNWNGLGFEYLNFGTLVGIGKDGRANPGGGETNAKIAFLRSISSTDRYCVFTEINAHGDAGAVLNTGVNAILI